MEKVFRTRSLQTAAFIYIQEDVQLLNFDESDPRNIHFEFTPEEKAKEYESAYIMNTMTCNPKKLMEAFNTLKEKVFQIKRENSISR